MSPIAPSARVLLTGATGFVGSHLWPALVEAGHDVRGLSRDPERAARRWPKRTWVRGDVESAADLEQALAGVDAAYYLIHGMAGGEGDLQRREVAQARRFAEAAASASVKRIVYLGGPASPAASEHLRSRLAVGEALRSGAVPAVELRASMIIGHGSTSWLVVRDLAARLPVMILPRWLRSRTQPVALDDVVRALRGTLDLPLAASAWFDLPGPEILSGRQILERAANVLGLRGPRIVEVPFLTPWLSSHWVHLVTRAEWNVARALVAGLEHDILAHDDLAWRLLGSPPRLDFDEAARRALAEERTVGPPPSDAFSPAERLTHALRGREARAR